MIVAQNSSALIHAQCQQMAALKSQSLSVALNKDLKKGTFRKSIPLMKSIFKFYKRDKLKHSFVDKTNKISSCSNLPRSTKLLMKLRKLVKKCIKLTFISNKMLISMSVTIPNKPKQNSAKLNWLLKR